MPRKLHFVKTENAEIYDELAKAGLGEKHLRIIDDGRVKTIEIGDEWTDADMETLKTIIRKTHPNHKLMKEE